MADLEARVTALEAELKETKEKLQNLIDQVGSGKDTLPKTPRGKTLSATSSTSKPVTAERKKSIRPPTLSSSSSVPDEKIAVDPAFQVTYNIGKRKQHVIIPADVDPAEAKVAAEAKTSLALSRVYGFNGKNARHNLYFSREKAGSLIYSVAATGVTLDVASGAQSFFTGHNEDILCLAYHPTRPLVATGQLDPKGKGTPFTCVWDHTTSQEVARIVFHDRGVCAVGFSADGKYLLTVGNDDSHTLAVFEWEGMKSKGGKAVPVLEQMTSKDEMYGIEVNHHAGDQKGVDIEFVSFGAKTLKHWQITNIASDDKKQRQAKSRLISVSNKTNIVQKAYTSVAFAPNGSGEYLVGCASGHIYRLKQDSLVSFFAAHAKSVGAVRFVEDGFVSAGSDGKFNIWDNEGKQIHSIDLQDGGSGRSIAISGSTAVVGTASNSIVEIDLKTQDQRVLMIGHSNEVWGLAVSGDLLVTGGFDKRIIAWNYQNGSFLPVHELKVESKVKSVAFDSAGARLALGMENGALKVVQVAEWKEEWTEAVAKETIDGLSWSPDNTLLAAGSWDQKLYVVSAEDGSKKAVCTGHTSSVLMVNWSADGKYIQTNSRDYEILYWSLDTGKRLKDRLEIKDIKWHGWNCFLGWCVAGIWGGTGDGTDINAVDRSHKEDVIAAGDDFGMVRLYKYPCVNVASPVKEFPGHSSHVTNVRFSPDDSVLFSTGGADCGVFMWRHE